MRKFFIKTLAALMCCLFAVSGFNFSVIADDTGSATGETLSAMNVEVSGKLSLLFYFKDLENVSYFKVSVPERDGSFTTTKVPKSALLYDKEKDRYTLKVKLASAQLTEQVSIRAYSADDKAGKLRYYSVRDYADRLLALADANPDNATYAAAAAAVKSMLNYGAMAQTFFGYKTSALANDGIYYRRTNPVDGMSYDDLYDIVSAEMSVNNLTGSAIDPNAPLKFTHASAYLEDTVSLRFYFSYSGTKALDELIVQIDEETYSQEICQDENDDYYILINDIPSSLFNTQYQILISEGENWAVIKYSVLNYLQSVIASTDDEALRNVAYSMFQFYAWTNEYLGKDVITDSYATACLHDRTHIASSDKAIICSDCGKGCGTAGVIASLDESGNVTLTDGFAYTVSGGNFTYEDEEGFIGITADTPITFSGDKITSSASTNRFHLDYYASAPVKVTMKYSYGASNENTAEEYYYLEAGENTFSAVEWSFLASNGCTDNGASSSEWDKVYKYGENQNWKLVSITAESLTDSVNFALFGYSCETVSPSLSTASYNDKTCYISYVSNSRYKLGINLTWGGSISELYDLTANDGTITSSTNLINASDAGRLIQQSYYGTKGDNDGYVTHYWRSDSNYPYAEWNYNPVQGGDANNNQSRIIDFEIGSDYIYIKAQPLDWANHVLNEDGTTYTVADSRYTECYMENRYVLKDDYIQVDNRMIDYSGYDHICTTQELPAFYTLAYFDDYYWYSGTSPWTGADLTREDNLPFWGDSTKLSDTTFYYQNVNTETWAAFVNENSKYGIGMYVPNTDTFKGGRVEGSEESMSAVATDGYTSYFAPLKSFEIICYEPIEYSYLLCAGNIDTIRETFTVNKDFASNLSLDENSISQKLPDDSDMTFIDFSNEDSLFFLGSANETIVSYDASLGAARLEVNGTDSYFTIDYTVYSTTYSASDYSCIEFEYMIPRNDSIYSHELATGQTIFYQTGDVVSPSETQMVSEFTMLIADGEWHTVRYYTSNLGSTWAGSLNSLRIDFLNNGIDNGQVLYLKSFSLTDSADTNASAAGALNVGFSGSSLIAQMTDGIWDNDIPTIVLCNGEFVRIVSGTGADKYAGFNLGGSAETGKYMVIKYRSYVTPSSGNFFMFATAGSTEISGTGDSGSAYDLVGDGRWHTLAIDLSELSANVASAGEKVCLNHVRIDIFDSFPTNSAIDIAYIGFCSDLSSIVLNDGEALEKSSLNWTSYVDGISADGNVIVNSSVGTGFSTNKEVGASYNNFESLNCTSWAANGWVVLDDLTITDIKYCIVDEDGVEHFTTVTKDGSGVNRWYERDDITTHAKKSEGLSYGDSTIGYGWYMVADLSAFEGQEIDLSVIVTASDGSSITTCSVEIAVPLSPMRELADLTDSLNTSYVGEELYNEIFGGRWDSFTKSDAEEGNIVVNDDYTVTVTGNKMIGFEPGGEIATGKYMVIRYRASDAPSVGIFYLYASSDDLLISNEDNMMTSCGLIGDGKWHTLVIDLSKISAIDDASNRRYYIHEVRLQMLERFTATSSVDFGYVGFCESLSDVKVLSGETVDYGWDEWGASLDCIKIDGVETSSKRTPSNANGATQPYTYSGSSWGWDGWIGVNGQTINELIIHITDKDGNEHLIPATKNGSETNYWKESDEITNHLLNSSNYAYGSMGYRCYLFADLTDYAGQTVTLTVIAKTSGGRDLTVYTVNISVPTA